MILWDYVKRLFHAHRVFLMSKGHIVLVYTVMTFCIDDDDVTNEIVALFTSDAVAQEYIAAHTPYTGDVKEMTVHPMELMESMCMRCKEQGVNGEVVLCLACCELEQEEEQEAEMQADADEMRRQ